MTIDPLTQERLKELMAYDEHSGIFTRLISVNSRTKVGDIVGSLTTKGYLKVIIDNKFYSVHRLVFLYMTGKFPEDEADHVNCIRTDNRWINLREAKRSENMGNMLMKTSNKSGFKGVSWHKASNAWIAQISINNKKKYLGGFGSPELAHEAYRKAAHAGFGEFKRFA